MKCKLYWKQREIRSELTALMFPKAIKRAALTAYFGAGAHSIPLTWPGRLPVPGTDQTHSTHRL